MTIGALLLVALPQVGLGDKGSSQHIEDVIPWLVLATLALISGVVSWLVTRWRVVGDELQIETGLIRRQSLRFPLRRVQAVDVVAPLTARLLGLAEVRIVSAGTGAQHGRLAYLRNDDATQVRAQLLALAHGLAAETPEPPAAPLFHVDNGALLASVLLRGPLLVVLVAAVVAAVIAATVGAGTVELLTTALTLVAGGGLEAARTFNADFDFTIGEFPDGLRLHRGLLQKRHETIPYGRIQAVRLLRPLPWRPFGWVRVELDVARQAGPRDEGGEVRQVSRLLAPVTSRQQALWLVSRVFPGAQMELGEIGPPPRRAMLRAPLSFHYLRLWHRRHLPGDPDGTGPPGHGGGAPGEGAEHPSQLGAAAAAAAPSPGPRRHRRPPLGGGGPVPGRGGGEGARRRAGRPGATGAGAPCHRRSLSSLIPPRRSGRDSQSGCPDPGRRPIRR